MFDRPINSLSRLKASFVRNGYGPAIVRRLLEEEGAERHFPAIKPESFAKARGLFAQVDIADQDMNWHVFPIYDAFIRKADPTADRSHKFTAWICRAYLHAAQSGQAIMAEDIYKIADDLRDFEVFSGQMPIEKRDINAYPTYDALIEALRPYQQKRDARKEQRGHMAANMKKDSVIFYDGPEGKIVMPLTAKACQLWGRQTRWCIAAKGENNAFDEYNNQGPIFIFLPKVDEATRARHTEYTSFKFALVHGEMWDERDHALEPALWCVETPCEALREANDFPPGALIKAAREKLDPRLFGYILRAGAHITAAENQKAAPCIFDWLQEHTRPVYTRQDQSFTDEQHQKDYAVFLRACDALDEIVEMEEIFKSYFSPLDTLDLQGFQEAYPELFEGEEVKIKDWFDLGLLFKRRITELSSFDDLVFFKKLLQTEMLHRHKLYEDIFYGFNLIRILLLETNMKNRSSSGKKNNVHDYLYGYGFLDEPKQILEEFLKLTNEEVERVIMNQIDQWHSYPDFAKPGTSRWDIAKILVLRTLSIFDEAPECQDTKIEAIARRRQHRLHSAAPRNDSP